MKLYDIPDHPGYKVTRNGRLFSFKRYPEGRELKQGTDEDGYKIVAMQVNGVSVRWKVHRLVATVLIPNPNDLPQVNHKDGDKANNDWENLEWCTNTHNQRHAWNSDLKTVVFTVAQVAEIKTAIINGTTNKELSEKYCCDPSLISFIRTGRTWKDVQPA